MKRRGVSRLSDDIAKGAEVGVFLMEIIHSVIISAGVCAAIILIGQIAEWCMEHEPQIELAEHAAVEVIERTV